MKGFWNLVLNFFHGQKGNLIAQLLLFCFALMLTSI